MYPNCYLQLTGTTTFRTLLFQIQGPSGASRTWEASATLSTAQPASPSVSGSSSAAGPTRVSSAVGAPRATSTPAGSGASIPSNTTRSATLRPSIGLASDNPSNHYILPNGLSCLLDGDEITYHPECWKILNITYWLPAWYSSTIHPGTNVTWSNTFLHDAAASGGNTVCTDIAGGCQVVDVVDDGKNAPPLERARIRYVRQSIYGTSLPEIFSSRMVSC